MVVGCISNTMLILTSKASNYVMYYVLTMTYSLSKQGKHLRKLTTISRLGPAESRTKILMACILVVKLTATIFYRNINKCIY
jgi:hypothetical protein